MRSAVLGVLGGAGLAVFFWAAVDRPPAAFAERAASFGAGSDSLIALASPTNEGGQMVTILDPRMRAMGVYRVDAAGKIKLLAVRNVTWDLQMMQLNSDNPLPQEIKSLLEQR